MPEVQPAAEKATAEYKKRETAFKSTFGKDFGVCEQGSISTILVKKLQNNINRGSDTLICAVSYSNHCCCIDGNYSSNITIDIVNPQNFKSGQDITLPAENIKIKFKEDSDGEKALGFLGTKNLINGVLHFDKIAADTIVLSVILSIEYGDISDETVRKSNSTIIDYGQLEFLADTFLTKYEFDYGSFSAVNEKARIFLYSLYPRTSLISNYHYSKEIHSGQKEPTFELNELRVVPEFPGGQAGLSKFFKENLPCPDPIQQYTKPNTYTVVLEIGPDGKLKNNPATFGIFSNNLDPTDPEYGRIKAERDFYRKLNGILQYLPAFQLPEMDSNKLEAINYYRYEFPVIFNCD